MSRGINHIHDIYERTQTLGLNVMLMILMLPCGPLKEYSSLLSLHEDGTVTALRAQRGSGVRDNPEGPIQINTLLLTLSQTSSLHYHSIKTAYLNRPGLERPQTV